MSNRVKRRVSKPKEFFVKKSLLAIFAFAFSASVFAVEGSVLVNDEGAKALRLLSQHCVPQLSKATNKGKRGSWIGTVSYAGDWNSNSFTVSYALFEQDGLTSVRSAGTIELVATPIQHPAADGPSYNVTCTY